MRPDTEKRRQRVRELRAQGMTLAQVSEKVGVTTTTVKRYEQQDQQQDAPPPPTPTWMERAACRGMDPALFFDHIDSRAIAACARCPVREQCEQYADTHQTTAGLWAGRTYNHGYRSQSRLGELADVGRVDT